MEAITNSTVLIFLSKINNLKLLNVYSPLMTTSEVKKEVLEGKTIPETEKTILEQYFKNKIIIKNVSTSTPRGLGTGESSAINLCTTTKINIFLSDDKKARTTATLLHLTPIGTIGVLLLNLQKGKITKQEALTILDALVQTTYYISASVYSKVRATIERCE